MTQRQYSVIKFSYFTFLPLKVSNNKTRVLGHAPQHHRMGVAFDRIFCLQLFNDTKSIFYHQIQFFYFFYPLKSVITNLGWMMGNPK